MKNTPARKVLALLPVLCLVCALLPAAPASAYDCNDQRTHKFKRLDIIERDVCDHSDGNADDHDNDGVADYPLTKKKAVSICEALARAQASKYFPERCNSAECAQLCTKSTITVKNVDIIATNVETYEGIPCQWLKCTFVIEGEGKCGTCPAF